MNVKYLAEMVNDDDLAGGQHLPMSRSLEDGSREAYKVFDDTHRNQGLKCSHSDGEFRFSWLCQGVLSVCALCSIQVSLVTSPFTHVHSPG